MTIRILQMNNDFQPLGKALPKPAEKAPEAVQIKPGIWRNPDGKLETRESVTAPLHAPKKQMPNALADGWIPHTAGRCPIPFARGGEYEIRWADGSTDIYATLDAKDAAGWESGNIVAYRLLA